MNVKLKRRPDGKWQADVLLPDGREFHGSGNEPGDALVSLGAYWLEQPRPNDMQTLARILVEERV